MRHFLYPMVSAAPAPAGDGDTASWFRYYKWPGDEEAYVPRRSPFLRAVPGDYLWFVLDGLVLGGVELERIEIPSLPTMKQELWYDQKKIVELYPTPSPPSMTSEGDIDESVGAQWLKTAHKRA